VAGVAIQTRSRSVLSVQFKQRQPLDSKNHCDINVGNYQNLDDHQKSIILDRLSVILDSCDVWKKERVVVRSLTLLRDINAKQMSSIRGIDSSKGSARLCSQSPGRSHKGNRIADLPHQQCSGTAGTTAISRTQWIMFTYLPVGGPCWDRVGPIQTHHSVIRIGTSVS
jgi:hypothetical protein